MIDGVCANCGSADWHVLNRRERFVSWFQSGPGANDVRRWDPTPLFYSFATAAGLVVGGAAATITRRGWMVVATPLAAFLATFAIATRPVFSRQGRELVREFVDPVGSERRHVARRAAALRAQHGRVPVLVPATWNGAVRLVGIGLGAEADAPLRSVTVAADPPDGGRLEPRVALRTRTPDEFDPDIAVMVVANAEHRGGGTPVGHGSADLQMFQMPDPSPERVAELHAAWSHTTLAVDGEPVAARLLAGRSAQVAVIDLGDHVVEITGYGVELEHVPLHRPADLEPLIAAFEADRLGGT